MPGVRTFIFAALFASTAHAQTVDGVRAGVIVPVNADSGSSNQGDALPVMQRTASWRKFAPIASAIVPGSGQMALGNNRFVAYLAVEAVGWWMYAKDVSERSAQEARFKEIAREVARVHFTKSFPDADWAYYEWVRDALESGVYSKNTSGPLEPETDLSTYNGQRWETIQSIYPTRAEALAAYERAAIKPEFQWSWRDHQLEWDIYKRYTDKRNDANRAAVRDILLIGANHILSMLDAFGTARLTAMSDGNGAMRLGASVRW